MARWLFPGRGDSGDGDPSLAMAAVGRDVLILFTSKNLSSARQRLINPVQRACFAQRFAEAAKSRPLMPSACSSRK